MKKSFESTFIQIAMAMLPLEWPLEHVVSAPRQGQMPAARHNLNLSGDSWMTYPYGKSLYNPDIVGIYSPRIPREHNRYHGYTVRGTPTAP